MAGPLQTLAPARVAVRLPIDFRRTFLRLARELAAHEARWGLMVMLYEHANDRDIVAAAIDNITPRPARVAADNVLHPGWTELETAIARAAEGASLVQVTGLERWLDRHDSENLAEPRLRASNIRREAFSQRVGVPVLMWMRQLQVESLATLAPDLWSWRSGIHAFLPDDGAAGPSAPSTSATPLPYAGDIDNRSEEQRRSRMEELRRYLGQSGGSTPLRLRAELVGELAGLHESLGELAEGLRLRQVDELPLYDTLGDERARAATMGRIADVLQARGEFDAALRIRREDELPVHERLGDKRSQAVTMSEIADILELRGDADEAMRIRRDEVLPVFERLGDNRAWAVAMGRIANALQARGEYEEALRIRQQDVLPVYERLGDTRSRAATMGWIADIHQARGELDDALRIRREEELPVYKRLGDLRSWALTMGQIADVLEFRGEFADALRMRRGEELPVYQRLHDLPAEAALQVRIGELLMKLADTQGDAELRSEAIDAFERAYSIHAALGDRAAEVDCIGRIDAALARLDDAQRPESSRTDA